MTIGPEPMIRIFLMSSRRGTVLTSHRGLSPLKHLPYAAMIEVFREKSIPRRTGLDSCRVENKSPSNRSRKPETIGRLAVLCSHPNLPRSPATTFVAFSRPVPARTAFADGFRKTSEEFAMQWQQAGQKIAQNLEQGNSISRSFKKPDDHCALQSVSLSLSRRSVSVLTNS